MRDITDHPPALTAAAVRAAIASSHQHIEKDGRIVVAGTGRTGTITPHRAVELAEAWRASFAPHVLSSLEQEHGARIDLESLRPDLHVLTAEAPFEVDPNVPRPILKAHSDYYIVQFRDGSGRPVISLAVSALNDDVAIRGDQLVLPRESGNAFRASGVPRALGLGLPLAAEHAIVRAYSATGVHVAGLPRLLQVGTTATGMPAPPERAIWRVPLASAVQFRELGTRRVRTEREVYIDAAGQLLLPTLAQASSRTTGYALRGPGKRVQTVIVKRRGETPISFTTAGARVEP